MTFTAPISIKNLALLISRIANYEVEIKFDKNMPDGTPRKILDSSIINNLGWKPEIPLSKGLLSTLDWFQEQM